MLYLYITVFKNEIYRRKLSRLSYICNEENIECDDSTLNKLVATSGGDMRRAITCLQSCAKLKGANSKIDIDSVLEVTGVINSYNFFFQHNRHKYF